MNKRRARFQTRYALAVSDARIQQRVKQVYDQIGSDYEEAGEEHGPHDHGYVLVLDRLPSLGADAGPPEDLLDHQQPAQSVAQVHAEHGDDRPHGVAEGVLGDHSAVLQALGPRCADVALAQHLEHPRPRHAGVEGRLGHPEGEGGEHQAHKAARAPEGKDRELVGEDVEQNDPQPELWKGQAYENKDVGKPSKTPRLTATMMPVVTPMASSIRTPTMVSAAVYGKRSMIAGRTSCWVLYDRPKSPCSARFTNSTYWM